MKKTKAYLSVLGFTILVLYVWLRHGILFPEWLSVIFCVWIWLIGPVILYFLVTSAKEEIDFEDPKGVVGIILRVLVCTPLGCTGLLFASFGISVFLLFIWQSIVHGDFSWVQSVRGFWILGVMIVLGCGMVYSAFRKIGPNRRETAAYETKRREALKKPDWSFYENHLQRPVPISVYNLLSDPEKVFREPDCSENKWAISEFSPINKNHLLSRNDTGLDFDIVPFAFSSDADPIFLMPGKSSSNCVCLAFHDFPSEIKFLAEDVDKFIRALRWESEKQ